ncbi:MAG: hypothetical protein ACREFP_07070, partial [Acetobacteraceae bacterium]
SNTAHCRSLIQNSLAINPLPSTKELESDPPEPEQGNNWVPSLEQYHPDWNRQMPVRVMKLLEKTNLGTFSQPEPALGGLGCLPSSIGPGIPSWQADARTNRFSFVNPVRLEFSASLNLTRYILNSPV